MDKMYIIEHMNGLVLDEDFEYFKVDEVEYGIEVIEELQTVDQGKYQFGGNIIGVGILDKTKGWGIVGDVLFYIRQDFTKSGSYFSEFYFEYEHPYEVERKEVVKTVWEKVK